MPTAPRLHQTAFVAPGARLIGDVTLEAEASVWYNAVLRGDLAPIVLGAQSNIQDNCVVHVDEGVPCRIGARVGVGHGAILHGCEIEEDCLVGMGAIVLNHAHVGRGSVIGAGSLVPERIAIPPGSLVLGVPGRVVRSVDADLTKRIERTWRSYVDLGKRHRGGDFGT
jgi:carbonic anhydrase/acetyltransferase-like protein (isoleucine patch superfamily)